MAFPSNRAAPLYAGLAFSFFFVAFGILLLISTIRGLHLAAQSTDWPATSGVVDESTVERHAGSRNSTATYSAKVLYSYEVNGKKLHGSTISFLYVTSGRQSDAASVCNAYPKNKPVTVYYSPHAPELSVLERGVKPLAWALPILGLVITTIGIVVTVFTWRSMKAQAAAKSVAGEASDWAPTAMGADQSDPFQVEDSPQSPIVGPLGLPLWFFALCALLSVGSVACFVIYRGTIAAGGKGDAAAAAASGSARSVQPKETPDLKDEVHSVLPGVPRAIQPGKAPEEQAAAKRADARERKRGDRRLYTPQQLREIDALHQVVQREWPSEAARKSLQTLLEKYSKANRTGCALVSLGQRGRAEERITYLKQAIAEHGDCFYGDGVQVGAYARLLLGRLYFEDADPDKAKTLFDEIRNSYADAVDHQGRSLLAQLPARDRSPVNVVESNPPPRRLPVQLATGLLAAIALVCVVGFVSRSLALRRMNDPSGIADSYIPAWQEVESKVYCPALWLALLAGAVFASAGLGFSTLGVANVAGMPFWLPLVFGGVFVLAGGLIMAWAVGSICWPVYVRHAAPDVLPNVPREPVMCEGSIVQGRLTHELCEDAQGWEFRPAGRVHRTNLGCMLAFGIPFLAIFAGIGTWVIHDQLKIGGWPIAAACAILATVVCGGTPFLAIALGMRADYRRLSKLTIPRDGNDLELETEEAHHWEKADLAEGLKWLLLGDTKRRRLTIPRKQVVAVELCPWKYVVYSPSRKETTKTWAVQGLLVLAPAESGAYRRLPVLLTGDFIGAAGLMRKLADTLQVPYLFCADAAGWGTEGLRAKSRPPLQVGGSWT